MNRLLFCILTTGIIFAASDAATAANRKNQPAKPRYYAAAYYAPQHAPYRRGADGILIDRDGWRNTASWNNTCFRTLDWLHSDSACSGGGF